jgi:hypothetical protein
VVRESVDFQAGRDALLAPAIRARDHGSARRLLRVVHWHVRHAGGDEAEELTSPADDPLAEPSPGPGGDLSA